MSNASSHRHTKSLKILPQMTQNTEHSPQPIKTMLPKIKRSHSSLRNASNISSLSTKVSINLKPKAQQPDPHQQQLINKIRQNAKLLKILKTNILQLKDNVLVNKIISQIKHTTIGIVAVGLWNSVQRYQRFDLEFMGKLEEKYGIRITMDFVKTMNFINNVCRFFYADYKKKRWKNKQKQIQRYYKNIDQSKEQVSRKIRQLQAPQIKKQIISSMIGIRQQCYANKPCYMNWKQRAIQQLKQKQVKCQILRAEIFTQGFF